MSAEERDTWFLLVQYRRKGKTTVTKFAELPEAVIAYNEAERKHKDKMHGRDPEVDVLLVGASSEAVVRERYPSYFTTGRSKAERVTKLLAALPPVPAH
ncbi:hypothetical protein [Amycolatopsis thermoflava]|uniref:hypothetical protein n=1 Tax=Amycolatopsis thermoflava TaxID=84480 RepID=UPI0036464805